MSEIAKKKAEFEARLQGYVGLKEGPPFVGPDLVNEPMIRHWCEVLGDQNAAYLDPDAAKNSVHGGIVAPPTMMQAWAMRGYPMHDADSLLPRNKQRELHAVFDQAGYTGVVATDCEQEYRRYLRPGDQVTEEVTIESISDEKATGLGIGYFILTRHLYTDQQGEEVGWMTFRVLKFKPQEGQEVAASSGDDAVPAPPGRIRPPVSKDVEWWWRDGIEQGKLVIQQCSACGVLRHPPRPICGACQSMEWGHVESTGKGIVHSYVIMHHPPIPGYGFPIAVGLIDLEEGTRIVSNVVGCDLDDVHIGMKVELSIENVDDELKLPLFKPAK